MERRIHKYAIQPPYLPRVLVDMPAGAKVLSVQMELDMPWIWAVVDPEAPDVQRAFWLVRTGDKWPDESRARYLTTLLIGAGVLTLHVFEELPK